MVCMVIACVVVLVAEGVWCVYECGVCVAVTVGWCVVVFVVCAVVIVCVSCVVCCVSCVVLVKEQRRVSDRRDDVPKGKGR